MRPMRHLPFPLIIAAAAWLSLCLTACSGTDRRPTDSLARATRAFDHPEPEARTRIWWFHGHRDFNPEGMTADLEAMARAGLGGVVFYDQVHGVADSAVPPSLSDPWWRGVRHAASECARLGLSMEMHVGSGFVAGGPWIGPEDAMKRLATVETVIEGDRDIDLQLSTPTGTAYWKDVCLLAIPTRDEPDLHPVVTTDIPRLEPDRLWGGDELLPIAPPTTGAAHIDIVYPHPVIASSITYLVGPQGKATTSATQVPGPPGDAFTGTGYRTLPPIGRLQWIDDRGQAHDACTLKTLYRAHESYKRKTLTFPAVRARHFRISLSGWDGADRGQSLRIGGIGLSGDVRVNEYEYRAAYISEYTEPMTEADSAAMAMGIPREQVIDLSAAMDSTGHLRWHAPAGRWRLLRMGMVPTGARVKHARRGGGGLECDKMSARAARLQFDAYVGRVIDSLRCWQLPPLAGMAMDSHEAGSQNWTDDFTAAFARLRGYDLRPWLPVMAGYIVDNALTTDRVLYDVRQTIAELIADRYYGTMDSLCRAHDMTLTAQATGNAQCIVATPIAAKGRVAKPQGEFWLIHPDGNYDVKEASSAAHLYGKAVASAEAFTDGRADDMPADLKAVADVAYAFGANEFVVCASAHQPTTIAGGYHGGRGYATHTRNNTWWHLGRPFWDYQARTSAILRTGLPVTDLLIYIGNNAPTRILTHRLPMVPTGYDWDACTDNALLHRLTMHDGHLALPTGQTYTMLVLPRDGSLTWDVLCRVAEWVRAGLTVYGPRPTGSPAWADHEHDDAYRALVHRLWDQGDTGRGHIYTDIPLADAMRLSGLTPDLEGDTLHYAHRHLSDADLYFVHNHSTADRSGAYTFRTPYRRAYLWDARTGRRYCLPTDGTGQVRLALPALSSALVVLCSDSLDLPPLPTPTDTMDIDGPWTVDFVSYDRADTTTLRLPHLAPWTSLPHRDLRHHAGIAIYRTTIRLAADTHQPDAPALLDIDAQRAVVEVRVNNQTTDTLFASPYRTDIGPHLHDGANEVELRVTHSWHNRAVLDLQLPSTARVIAHPEYLVTPADTLHPAGLTRVSLLR